MSGGEWGERERPSDTQAQEILSLSLSLSLSVCVWCVEDVEEQTWTMNTTRATAEALLERNVEDVEEGAWTREGSERGEEHVGRAAMLAAVSTNDVRAVREAVDRARERGQGTFDVDAKDVVFVHPKQGPLGRCAQVKKGWTLLHLAAYHGALDTVAYLLSLGADGTITTQDGDQLTPLHCAAAGGSAKAAEVIGLLLQCGADKEAKDARGRRPADLLPPPEENKLECIREGQEGPNSPRRSDSYGRGSFELNREDYETDEFRMYSFKVVKCPRSRAHDWTECPFAHPGEKARRRDPRKYNYSGNACPDFRKGSCKRGDACEHAHGVFECWLHPSRYRTQLCKDGTACTRKVCFFAHRLEELRAPSFQWSNSYGDISSPTSTLDITGSMMYSPRSSTASSQTRRSLDERMSAEYLTNQLKSLGVSPSNHPWTVDNSYSSSSSQREESYSVFPSMMHSRSSDEAEKGRLSSSRAASMDVPRNTWWEDDERPEKSAAPPRVNSMDMFNDFVNDLVEEEEAVHSEEPNTRLARRSVDSQLQSWNLFAY